MLIINPGTGRKELKKGAQGYLSEIYFLRQYLMSGTWTYNNSGLGDTNPEYSKCIDTYGKTIINQLTNIYGLYMNPRNFIYPQS